MQNNEGQPTNFSKYGIDTTAAGEGGHKGQHENKSWLDCIPGLRGETDRQGFVKKVYSLVFLMLLMATIFTIIPVCSEPVREFMIYHSWLYYVSSIITIVMLLSLLCFYKILKRVPINYIFLIVFTIAKSYSVASLTCHFEPASILYAAILTSIMGLSLSLFACFTKADLTSIYHALCWISLGVSLGAMILMLIIRSHWILIICSWVFLIIAGLYLIVDTQMIIGGRGKQLSLDDYIIGALILFIDFVSIFINLLAIIGSRR